MYLQQSQKAGYTEQLRQYISQQVTEASKTNRTEASFTALSYQSRSYPKLKTAVTSPLQRFVRCLSSINTNLNYGQSTIPSFLHDVYFS